MSLSEKAKTLPQIEKDFLTFKYEKQGTISQQEQMDKFNKIQWVRLEDAQQEIDKHGKNNKALAEVCSNLNDKIERLERERGEQKQKLETCLSHRPLLPSFTHGTDTSSHIDIIGLVRAYQEWYAELEELLKETK
jgi:predicted nuclease with TOPRIM domain